MMTGYGRQFDRGGEKASRFGFTLIELLVVIAIISIISAIVSVSFLSIAREARLSSGTNIVISAIGNARALAMKNNRLVLVVFRPRLLENGTQIVEIVTAQWTGESFLDTSIFPQTVLDRFEPIEGVAVRRLPRGIKVAGPMYAESTGILDVDGTDAGDLDSFWSTQAQLPAINQSNPTDDKSEPSGRLIGIMFSPDGTTISVNSQSDATASYIDFDRDRLHRVEGVTYDYTTVFANGDADFPGILIAEHRLDNDEPVVMIAPYLAVFDDEQFREFSDPASWTDSGGFDTYSKDLRRYLNQNANRIHFNSYTGVALR